MASSVAVGFPEGCFFFAAQHERWLPPPPPPKKKTRFYITLKITRFHQMAVCHTCSLHIGPVCHTCSLHIGALFVHRFLSIKISTHFFGGGLGIPSISIQTVILVASSSHHAPDPRFSFLSNPKKERSKNLRQLRRIHHSCTIIIHHPCLCQ